MAGNSQPDVGKSPVGVGRVEAQDSVLLRRQVPYSSLCAGTPRHL